MSRPLTGKIFFVVSAVAILFSALIIGFAVAGCGWFIPEPVTLIIFLLTVLISIISLIAAAGLDDDVPGKTRLLQVQSILFSVILSANLFRAVPETPLFSFPAATATIQIMTVPYSIAVIRLARRMKGQEQKEGENAPGEGK